MIPKIIHYCWFGGKPKTKEVLSYIETWKRCMPDFIIKEWNEENFNIKEACDYVKEAYNESKYAFVSDFVRIYALYNEGGIYLDTDVEVLKTFRPFLTFKTFFGLEEERKVATCVIGSERKCLIFRMILDYYLSRHFINGNNKPNLTPNTVIISKIIEERYGTITSNFISSDGLYIAPLDRFSPKDFMTKKITITENTYSIHHFDGTWIPLWKKCLLKLWLPFNKAFPKFASFIKNHGLL